MNERVNGDPAAEYTRFGSGPDAARVRKVRTGNGHRLEIAADNRDEWVEVRLDALLLESLTWQTQQTFDRLFGPGTEGEPEVEQPEESAEDGESGSGTEYTEISNEFATTLVRPVGSGERAVLEVRSPKMGYSIRLGSRILNRLAHQTPEKLSEMLEEPYGPTGSHEGEAGLLTFD